MPPKKKNCYKKLWKKEKAKAQLEQANAEQRAAYEAQIAELERKYQEAEERNKRALSMAQQTKAGYVYIISNEGSFGQNIYKIGMTRRLEPLDRVRELSSASVPFAFDVHALIWSDDAPALENMLHKKFALSQVNKVNFRKEFFRLSLSEIRAELEKSGLNVKWTMTAEAREYRETLTIEKAIQDNPQAREDWPNH
ncbi:MAG: GIY-YIG nuclease family protein, partial [Synergistaceae bacterium]|nr:GIY-YIG nuclease family protein [Synergistaceae bacterium]